MSEVTLRGVRSRYIGGRRVTISGEPVQTVTLSDSLPGYVSDPNDTFHVEHAYVQEFELAEPAGAVPVVLVHGGGMSGACWGTTPDGRPGWDWRILAAGWSVVTVDNVERGRAGWCALPGVWPGAPVTRGERDMWSTFRIGPEDGYPDRVPYEDGRFPITGMDQALAHSVPRWPENGELAVERLVDVVDAIGPCVLIGHSQGGGLCAQVAVRRAQLVRAAVLLEPHGLPRVVDAAPAGPPVMLVFGDFMDRQAMWQELRAESERYATARGSGTEILDLPAERIAGNSHNPMMDTNSDEVCDRVLDWLATVVLPC